MKSTLIKIGIFLILCDTTVPIHAIAQTSPTSKNPLLIEWTDSCRVPPFDKIQSQHFVPAFKVAIDEQIKNIESIIDNPQKPNFDNTIDAFEKSGSLLKRTRSLFYNLLAVKSDNDLQKKSKEVIALLSKHQQDIMTNPKLFDRIKFVYKNRGVEKISVEQQRILEKCYWDFINNGADLNPKELNRLQEIDKQLILLHSQFNNNFSKETNRSVLIIDKKEDLSGLPESFVNMACNEAKNMKLKNKWAFPINRTNVIYFLTYAKNRSLREKIHKTYLNIGNNDNEFDNKKIISQILALRLERSNILGFKTYADYSLESTMAKNAKNVMQFLNTLWNHALKSAQIKETELQRYIEKRGENFKIKPWDWRYYSEKLLQENYESDPSKFAPYFKLSHVCHGLIAIAEKMFDLEFVKKKNTPLYSPDVDLYEVWDGKTLIGVVLFDLYSRSGKDPGSWVSSYRTAHYQNGKRIVPIISLNTNIIKSIEENSTLLGVDDVEMLFFEFGHILQKLASTCQYDDSNEYPSDFDEFLSRFLRNYALNPSITRMYARHFNTATLIPAELIDGYTKSQQFIQGYETVENLASAILDMKFHMMTTFDNFDIKQFESQTISELGLIPSATPQYGCTNFTEIFSSEKLASKFYSGLWSEMFCQDALEAFIEKGNILDPTLAKSLRETILEKGNSEDLQLLYKNFRGREAELSPIFKNRGLQ